MPCESSGGLWEQVGAEPTACHFCDCGSSLLPVPSATQTRPHHLVLQLPGASCAVGDAAAAARGLPRYF